MSYRYSAIPQSVSGHEQRQAFRIVIPLNGFISYTQTAESEPDDLLDQFSRGMP